MTLQRIFNRVADWNEARYPREYNHELTLELLDEELQELNDAETPVDKLDALCDIVYVSYGALWKLGVNNLTLGRHKTLAFYINGLKTGVYEQEITAIANAAIEMMGANFSLRDSRILKALSIVCDSNDSKIIEKTSDTSIKVCKNKGPGFIAPEPRLKRLLKGDTLWKI